MIGLRSGEFTKRKARQRTRRLLPLLWPQGAHRQELTARFPLQGALQTLPVTGPEPDMQRSPQTTPPAGSCCRLVGEKNAAQSSCKAVVSGSRQSSCQ